MDCCFCSLVLALLISYYLLKWILGTLKIDNLSDRHVFVTGCDTGFGNLLAKRLDSLGIQVFAGCLTEKGGEDLQKATSTRLKVIRLDVTNTLSIAKSADIVKKTLPLNKGLWGLVNNAGVVGNVGHTEWQTADAYKKCMDVNFLGMTEVTRVFLPLVRKSRGRIVNVTSFLARLATVHTAPYNVSKFAAEGYCNVLRRDLQKCGVSVHIIEPGSFNTGIINVSIIKDSLITGFDKLDPELKEFYGEDYVPRCINLFNSLASDKNMSEDLGKVVDAYTHAVTAKYPKIRYIVGLDAKVISFLSSVVPEWVVDKIFATMLPIPSGAKSTTF